MYNLTLKIDIGCNLKCPYCIEHINDVKIFSEDNVRSQLDKLPDILKNFKKPNSITFLGGEPGLWSYKLTGRLISIIDNAYGHDIPISVCTNGLFMKKFPFLVNDKRYTFTYHITDPENYDVSKDPYVKLKNVSTAIVVTKDLQNNYELLKKYNDECSYVDWQPCIIDNNHDKSIFDKYQFDFSNIKFFNIKNTQTYIGENCACYNKILNIDPKIIKLYNCCSHYEDSSIILDKNTDYDLINNYYISLDELSKRCKYCNQHFDEYSFKNN